MKGAQRWLLHGTTALAAATGLAYAAFRYLLEGEDPFSAYNHPAQPWALHLHVLVVPVMLFAIGWFWGRHVVPKLREETAARRSGLTLIGLVAVMTASGYLLQVTGSPAWRVALAWLHGASGTLFAGLLVGHVVAGLRAAARGRTTAGGTGPVTRLSLQ